MAFLESPTNWIPLVLSSPSPAIYESLSLLYLHLLFMTGIWDSTFKRFIHPSKCDPQNPNPRTAWFVCADIYATFITEPSRWAQSGPNSSLHEWILKTSKQLSKCSKRASLVAQWLRICLLIQGTRVRALAWEDPTCRGAAGPVSHNC